MALVALGWLPRHRPPCTCPVCAHTARHAASGEARPPGPARPAPDSGATKPRVCGHKLDRVLPLPSGMPSHGLTARPLAAPDSFPALSVAMLEEGGGCGELPPAGHAGEADRGAGRGWVRSPINWLGPRLGLAAVYLPLRLRRRNTRPAPGLPRTPRPPTSWHAVRNKIIGAPPPRPQDA